MSDMRDLPNGAADDAEAAAAVKAAVQILSPTYLLVPRSLIAQLGQVQTWLEEAMQKLAGVLDEDRDAGAGDGKGVGESND